MKNLKVTAIITVFLVTLSATSLLAQNRTPERTSSAQAAYGYPTKKFKAKKKVKKPRKAAKTKTKKQPLFRKKNPWAN